jgi:hypothetical protein
MMECRCDQEERKDIYCQICHVKSKRKELRSCALVDNIKSCLLSLQDSLKDPLFKVLSQHSSDQHISEEDANTRDSLSTLPHQQVDHRTNHADEIESKVIHHTPRSSFASFNDSIDIHETSDHDHGESSMSHPQIDLQDRETNDSVFSYDHSFLVDNMIHTQQQRALIAPIVDDADSPHSRCPSDDDWVEKYYLTQSNLLPQSTMPDAQSSPTKKRSLSAIDDEVGDSSSSFRSVQSSPSSSSSCTASPMQEEPASKHLFEAEESRAPRRLSSRFHQPFILVEDTCPITSESLNMSDYQMPGICQSQHSSPIAGATGNQLSESYASYLRTQISPYETDDHTARSLMLVHQYRHHDESDATAASMVGVEELQLTQTSPYIATAPMTATSHKYKRTYPISPASTASTSSSSSMLRTNYAAITQISPIRKSQQEEEMDVSVMSSIHPPSPSSSRHVELPSIIINIYGSPTQYSPSASRTQVRADEQMQTNSYTPYTSTSSLDLSDSYPHPHPEPFFADSSIQAQVAPEVVDTRVDEEIVNKANEDTGGLSTMMMVDATSNRSGHPSSKLAVWSVASVSADVSDKILSCEAKGKLIYSTSITCDKSSL